MERYAGCFVRVFLFTPRTILKKKRLILKSLLVRVTLHLRIANQMVMGSYCRGGIVHIRFGCSRVLSKRSKKKKFFRHISLRARRDYDTKARSHALTPVQLRKKKGRRFAAGTRTLVDRGHYFHLKAGHDNHLHHSEPIRKWYDASFLTCVTLFSRY